MMKKATQEEAVAETAVFWDVLTCPVPPEYDARLVAPCIKRYLKNLGYSGPLTIIAIGLLAEVSEEVLQAVYSTGIVLNNVPLGGSEGILGTMYEWTRSFPPPANMMLISSHASIFPHVLRKPLYSGYNIFELCPYDSPNPESLWKDFLLKDSSALKEDMCHGTYETPSWLCSLCYDYFCEGFEDFTTHISSEEHELMATWVDNHAVAATTVFWDITSCPVPAGCDPHRVGPTIRQYLADLGYSGPITINAFGLLTDIPDDVLRAVSSSGIVLNHVSYDSDDTMHVMFLWTFGNKPPSNMMVICPYSPFLGDIIDFLQKFGYNIIQPFPCHAPYSESLWQRFILEDSGEFEETGEHASWVCSVCDDISGQGFENFIKHLKSREHKLEMNEDAVESADEAPLDSLSGYASTMDKTSSHAGHNINHVGKNMVVAGAVVPCLSVQEATEGKILQAN
ncbi:PREDICTED: uncharacterized protein LOC104738805 [Camelina sativa]|uniref:Uncharacterized protein LOC104738805 n=1 Tax=Camelina sativa TaxID=90675 RepID=A0ABM1QY37_CAMSA|nr:PREDICTED: uncharacterized protein LOC104738805 [Camelina sativa]XP_019091675.1 PREDICTED: uncharacterized protein LOC104738805 [Camelina sativa]XP_019091676.1 PREDICTED: uncharacterized protein LOC104738805 [Camelina sativa]